MYNDLNMYKDVHLQRQSDGWNNTVEPKKKNRNKAKQPISSKEPLHDSSSSKPQPESSAMAIHRNLPTLPSELLHSIFEHTFYSSGLGADLRPLLSFN